MAHPMACITGRYTGAISNLHSFYGMIQGISAFPRLPVLSSTQNQEDTSHSLIRISGVLTEPHSSNSQVAQYDIEESGRHNNEANRPRL